MCVAVMVPSLCSVNMLLAVLMLVSWTTSAWSDNLSGLYMNVDEVGFESREQVENVLNFAQQTMTAVKDVMDKQNMETVSGLLKGLSNFANVVPFIGPMFACANMLMAFVPQHDPVMQEIKEGFTEVNRKLDSLSIQVSNLATDVEWFTYANVYSQDEVRILNAWKKYERFFKDRNSNDISYLAKVFVNYYEYTQVEASVENLYHYLTVRDTSLSESLNNLLRKKFKCDLKKILNYNFYFSSLLMKGISLNNFYWKLIGYNTTEIEVEHIQMFKNVFAAQSEVVDFCLNNHAQYVLEDVVEIAKLVSSNNMQGIADKVKGFLDDKYDWYKWVVVVYKKSRESGEYIFVYDTMTKIPVNADLIVAVAYTQKADIDRDELEILNKAFSRCVREYIWICKNIEKYHIIEYPTGFELTFEHYVKITHSTYNKYYFAETPAPNLTLNCNINSYQYKTALHYSKTLPTPCNTKCKNNARCKRLLDSREALCECRDGFYGETCESKIDTNMMTDIEKLHLPIVKTTSARLANIEYKLNEILNKIQGQYEFGSTL
ncbi:hypothetical protein ACEWY4_004723 [Coilia grayii]|uniref:EGF-like domain-containing protein n=1 Tax=Coilia grayii TaxID=363190 RepID=A0ABD1KMB2_9TELE